MANTIKVTKDLELPYAFTLEALESFCEDTDSALCDINFVILAPKGQFNAAKSLLYHIVKEGFAELGEKMPYTKEDVEKWLKGKGVVNLSLLKSVILLAITTIKSGNTEEGIEEDLEKN